MYTKTYRTQCPGRRTPVSEVGRYLRSLSKFDKTLKTKTKSLLEEAEKASIRARSLTQQLLTFAKGGEPVKESTSLADVVRDSANFVLSGNAVACRYAIPDDLWLVDIDKGQISQVIQNLIINAAFPWELDYHLPFELGEDLEEDVTFDIALIDEGLLDILPDENADRQFELVDFFIKYSKRVVIKSRLTMDFNQLPWEQHYSTGVNRKIGFWYYYEILGDL